MKAHENLPRRIMLNSRAAICMKTAGEDGKATGLERSSSMDISKLGPQQDTNNDSAAVTY
jgi:hypothetical protein